MTFQIKCILLVAFLVAPIAASSQTGVEKSDHDLLIEIRQILLEQRLSGMRAQLLVKKIEIETNTRAELQKTLDDLQDKVEKNGMDQVSAARGLQNLRHKPLRSSQQDEDQTPDEERADEITSTEDHVQELSNKAAELDAKIKRVAGRIEATRQKLSQLEAELSKL